MIILGIETSCDETALALLECSGDAKNPHFKVLAEAIHSQIETHKQYGGVFPMMAKREHATNLIPLFKTLLKNARFLKQKHAVPTAPQEKHTGKLEYLGVMLEREPELQKQFSELIPKIEKPPIDAIAVTSGPGLEPALWVGINFTKALSLAWNIPIIPTNHMEGHIMSVLLDKTDKIEFPAVALLVSGGHTELILVKKWLDYKLLGETRDDAVGEAFDKVARILGLPYPGGPEISRLAGVARKNNYANALALPRPMLNSPDYDFSFSGLKTAVLYGVKKLGALSDAQRASVAREFEDSVTNVLIGKTGRALREYGAKTLVVGGGVIANRYLRKQMQSLAQQLSVKLMLPTRALSTDNAVMISIAAYMRNVVNKRDRASDADVIVAHGNIKLSNRQG